MQVNIRNNNQNIVYLDVSFTMAELQQQNRVRSFCFNGIILHFLFSQYFNFVS